MKSGDGSRTAKKRSMFRRDVLCTVLPAPPAIGDELVLLRAVSVCETSR
jgi:hypothetical protein